MARQDEQISRTRWQDGRELKPVRSDGHNVEGLVVGNVPASHIHRIPWKAGKVQVKVYSNHACYQNAHGQGNRRTA